MVLSDPWGREDALGVGETPGDAGCTLTTLSFDVRLGDNLEGKLRVFVHWDRERTILAVHEHFTDTDATRAHSAEVGGRMADGGLARRGDPGEDASRAGVQSFVYWYGIAVLNLNGQVWANAVWK